MTQVPVYPMFERPPVQSSPLATFRVQTWPRLLAGTGLILLLLGLYSLTTVTGAWNPGATLLLAPGALLLWRGVVRLPGGAGEWLHV